MVGENLDLVVGENASKDSEPQNDSTQVAAEASSPRKFIGVRFQCCGAYARAYLNRDETAYQANCPKCSRPIRFRVGPGGSDSRFFDVY